MPGHFQSHLLRSELIAGPAAIEAIPGHPLIADSRHALILVGKTVGATPFFARIVDALSRENRQLRIVRDVPSPAIDEVVERIATQYHEDPFDLIVAVGGGSTLDTAKVVALLIACGGKVEDHAHTRAGPPRPAASRDGAVVPVVAIPTTLSGSEANANASIRNAAMTARYSLVHAESRPRLVVMDPAALAPHGDRILFGSAFNALAHCIEGIYSKRHHALADAQAQAAARLLCRVIDRPGSVRDPEALSHLQIASLIAGGLISEVYVGLHHAICHALVSCCAVQHATANGTVLPWAVDFNLRALRHDDDRMEMIRGALDISQRSPDGATSAIRMRLETMQRAAGLPTSLSEIGVTRPDLDRIADYTLHDRALNTNPVPVEHADLIALLERAL